MIRVALFAALLLVQPVSARQTSVRVSGILRGIPSGMPAGLLRVELGATPDGPFVDVPLRADGTFEFVNVNPGPKLLSVPVLRASRSSR